MRDVPPRGRAPRRLQLPPSPGAPRPAPPRPARTPTRKAAATPRSEPSAPRVGPLARGVSTATVTRMTCVGATVQGPRGRARAEGERAQRGARGRALPGRVSLCAGPRGLRQV